MPEITDEFILSLFSNNKTREKAFEMLLNLYGSFQIEILIGKRSPP